MSDIDYQELEKSDFAFPDAQLDPGRMECLHKLIVSDLRPVRPIFPVWVFFSAFAVIFASLSYAGVSYLGPSGWFMLMPVQKIAIFSTLGASAALLAFSLIRQMVPGEKVLLRRGLLPIGIFVLLSLTAASVFQIRADPAFVPAGEACMKVGIPYAIPAVLLFWLILSRGANLSPGMTGAMSGMLAGLVSTTVLEIHCSNLNLWHILVWHLGIALLGLAAGFILAKTGKAIRSVLS